MNNKTVYDYVIIGSSPNLIYEGILKLERGFKVLLVESNERLGGAWSTIDLEFMKNADANCHIMLRSPKGYSILKSLGVNMVMCNPQPKIILKNRRFHYNSIIRYVIRAYETISKKQYSTKTKVDEISSNSTFLSNSQVMIFCE